MVNISSSSKEHLCLWTEREGKNYTNIPIGSSDAGGSYLQDLVTGVRLDYLFANIHPWFSENTYDQAAWFSWSFMQEVVGPLVNISAAAGNPGLELFQGEFGWPSDTDPSNPALGVNPAGSRAGITELQRVLEYVLFSSLSRFHTRLHACPLLFLPILLFLLAPIDAHYLLSVTGYVLQTQTVPNTSGSRRTTSHGRACLEVEVWKLIGAYSMPREIWRISPFQIARIHNFMKRRDGLWLREAHVSPRSCLSLDYSPFISVCYTPSIYLIHSPSRIFSLPTPDISNVISDPASTYTIEQLIIL